MLVYAAEIRVPDNATYYEIQEAQLKAEWKFKGEKHLRKEQMERTSLSGKCGSCKHFTEMPTLTSRCYGKCEKGRAGYKRGHARPANFMRGESEKSERLSAQENEVYTPCCCLSQDLMDDQGLSQAQR